MTTTYAGMRAAGYAHVFAAAEKYAASWLLVLSSPASMCMCIHVDRSERPL